MLFKNANIFVGGQFQHGSFRVENGRFAEILTTVPDEDGTDLQGRYVIPGLIDVHNHGNSGADFSDGDYDGLIKMARYLAQNGVTSFAPASMTLPYDVLEAAYKTAVQLKKAQPEGCARLIGIPVSYTHLRAHETGRNLVCRLLLEKKKQRKRMRMKTGKNKEKTHYRHQRAKE